MIWFLLACIPLGLLWFVLDSRMARIEKSRRVPVVDLMAWKRLKEERKRQMRGTGGAA